MTKKIEVRQANTAMKIPLDDSHSETWCLLHEITEERMTGKPTTGRRRADMLHDITKDDCYVALKQAVSVRQGWRYSGMMSKMCLTAEDRRRWRKAHSLPFIGGFEVGQFPHDAGPKMLSLLPSLPPAHYKIHNTVNRKGPTLHT